MLNNIVLVLTMIVSLLLIAVVLLQNSKGSGLAGAFGSMGAVQTLGVRRASDFLSKATTVLAALFLVLCVVAEYTSSAKSRTSGSGESVIQRNTKAVPAPALPPVQSPITQPQGQPAGQAKPQTPPATPPPPTK
ncbi:MAG: preprotein translocase subunit SecG [Rhizobacter sp.]|nr:preprotein translocase subunit SecG [Chlorobiales bacterium]